MSEDSSIKLPYMIESCTTKKEYHCSCSCGAEYCSANCRQVAYDTYHKSLCLGNEQSNDPNHPLNVLMDIWKFVIALFFFTALISYKTIYYISNNNFLTGKFIYLPKQLLLKL